MALCKARVLAPERRNQRTIVYSGVIVSSDCEIAVVDDAATRCRTGGTSLSAAGGLVAVPLQGIVPAVFGHPPATMPARRISGYDPRNIRRCRTPSGTRRCRSNDTSPFGARPLTCVAIRRRLGLHSGAGGGHGLEGATSVLGIRRPKGCPRASPSSRGKRQIIACRRDHRGATSAFTSSAFTSSSTPGWRPGPACGAAPPVVTICCGPRTGRGAPVP